MKVIDLINKLAELNPNWEVYAQDGSHCSTWQKVDTVEEHTKLERIYLETE